MMEGAILKPLELATCTMAYDTNFIGTDCEMLTKHACGKDDPNIIAIKSSTIPLKECLENENTKAKQILERRKNKKPARSMPGNKLFFQASVEYRKSDAENPDKIYNIRFSPAKGSVQIQGVREPIHDVAYENVKYILEYIKRKTHSIVPEYDIFNGRIIIANYKTEILSPDGKHPMISELADILLKILNGDINLDDEGIEYPFKIIHVTKMHESGSYIAIKFSTPIDKNTNRRSTVKLFSKGKISILGNPDEIIPRKIYKFLSDVIYHFRDRIFTKKTTEVSSIDTVIEYLEDLIYKKEYAWVALIKKDIPDRL